MNEEAFFKQVEKLSGPVGFVFCLMKVKPLPYNSLDECFNEIYSGMKEVKNYEPSKAWFGDDESLRKEAMRRAKEIWEQPQAEKCLEKFAIEKFAIEKKNPMPTKELAESHERFIKWFGV
jgi:hypothetical protein